MMVKHMLNLSDAETIQMIRENLYIQYFLGFDSFMAQAPFDSSLFVEIRKRLGMDELKRINDAIYQAAIGKFDKGSTRCVDGSEVLDRSGGKQGEQGLSKVGESDEKDKDETITHRGRMLLDATACPPDIAYPTDLKLLNSSREKCEEIIVKLFIPGLHGRKKPRTYRENARKAYLKPAKKKNRTKVELKTAIGKQLRYVNRNLKTIGNLLGTFPENTLK